MTQFTDYAHKAAVIGQHVVEFVEGQQNLSINGRTFTPSEARELIDTLKDALETLGL